MRKKSKKKELFDKIVAHAINSKNAEHFIYDLSYEFNSVVLCKKLGLDLGTLAVSDLEQELLTYPAKMVRDIMKELKDTFPYQPPKPRKK